MAEKRLALNMDGKMTYCTADEEFIGKGRCNHIAHQCKNESKEEFLNRMTEKEQLYSKYLCNEEYKTQLEEKFRKFIPNDLIQKVQAKTHGESWIITYGYEEEPYCNKGGWGSTEPYPFITSNGESSTSMYINKSQMYNINESNFVTAFNKNKDLKLTNDCFVLDRSKKLYKVSYPNVDKYEHVFIKHIPACS